ncbi:hypothetical protein D915_010365 [Fasciola hepatica]|uniref:Uncharacterized protein n=1 Tax=Fasciola hepatica TaxID=6192 RepID=A0A4E0R7L8_FASHE|nr:hypothetical protein D915_010365 [Fasciola hepatica]
MRNLGQSKLVLACLFTMLMLHLIIWIEDSFDNVGVNYAASLIRDDEEYRFAQALTVLNARKNTKGRFAFQYAGGARDHEKQPFVELYPTPELTFSILAANRWTHEIDDYEPSYLLESTANLLLAIEEDLSLYGARFSSINVTLCPTTDQVDQFSELAIISKLLPVEAIKKRQKPMDSFTLSCRTLLDVGSCIRQCVTSSVTNSYMVLLEDDLIAEDQLLQRMWDILAQFATVSPSVEKEIGAVVLYLRGVDFQFSLSDVTSMWELSILSFGFTMLIISFILPRWYRRFCFPSDFILVFLTFILSALIVCFIGRPRWTNWLLFLSRKQSFAYAFRPLDDSGASGLLIPSAVARSLGEYLWGLNCSELDSRAPFGLKSAVISNFLRTQNLEIYTIWPTLFRHRGLYSIYKNDIHDPHTMN